MGNARRHNKWKRTRTAMPNTTVQAGVGCAFMRDKGTSTHQSIIGSERREVGVKHALSGSTTIPCFALMSGKHANVEGGGTGHWRTCGHNVMRAKGDAKGGWRCRWIGSEESGGGRTLHTKEVGREARSPAQRHPQPKWRRAGVPMYRVQNPLLPNTFRFLLRATEAIDKMVSDADDRRIGTICNRFHCHVDIYAKRLIGGFMQYRVDMKAPNVLSLKGCMKHWGSALSWNLAKYGAAIMADYPV